MCVVRNGGPRDDIYHSQLQGPSVYQREIQHAGGAFNTGYRKSWRARSVLCYSVLCWTAISVVQTSASMSLTSAL
jgi:hypothetical protein